MGQLIRPDTPPQMPKLHASRVKLQDVLKPSYWEQLCPGLHVTDEQFMAKVSSIQLPTTRLDDLKEQVNYAGVAQVSAPDLPWTVDPDVVANAIISLMRYGWPPSFIVIYDEVWSIIKQAELLMDKATGGNACNMDILAWYVDPNRGDVGFSPHRDRQPDDSPATFRLDGTAMYATLWLPLTDATPENSCLYVIPRFSDPGYFEGDPDEDDAPDPLTTALPNKEAYQNIRALPAPKGSATIFTHRTIHWGSKGRPGYHTPRISMSWGCADDAYEPAYFSRQHLPCPPLPLRLALAGAQMIVYHERFPAPPKQLALYYQAFTAQADQFDAGYKAKVLKEFVDASKEATAAAGQTVAVNAKATAGRRAASGREKAAEAGDDKSAKSKARKGKQPPVVNAPVAAQEAQADEQQEIAAATERRGSKRGQKVVTLAVAVENATVGTNKRRKGKQQETTAVVEQLPEQPHHHQQQQGRKQKKRKEQSKQEPAAAGVESSQEEDGDGIDWQQVAAAARKAAKKSKDKDVKGSAAGAAAGGSSDDEVGFEGCDDSDGDVMDLALDSMLDAALAGGDDFQDDYTDE